MIDEKDATGMSTLGGFVAEGLHVFDVGVGVD